MMRKYTILLLAMVVFSAGTVLAEILYDVIDLGEGKAYSINDLGQIVGRDGSQATLFDTTGAGNNINLGTLGGNDSLARSINNNGQIVGNAKAGSTQCATLFDITGSGSNINLGGLVGDNNGGAGSAYSINDTGQIVGYTNRSGGVEAILFNKIVGGNNIRLTYHVSSAYSINNNGQIVGQSDNGSGDTEACLFNPMGGEIETYLGTLGGPYSKAFSINDNGQIVGSARNSTGYMRATLFDITGSGNNVNLGTLDGDYSIANSINDTGQIVGNAVTAADDMKATLFDVTGSGANIDLNTLIDPSLGWDLTVANCINDNGWIVGYGINPDGYRNAYLLTPVPEPIPPIANASGPYSVFVGDTLTLDGSGSTDPDGDIVSYLWDMDYDEIFETDAGGQAIFEVSYSYLQSLGLLVNYEYEIHLKVTDSEGQSDIAESTCIIIPKPATKVAVDIKPGSCPNPVNTRSSGVLPVAILGSNNLDVTMIDPASIRLAGVEPLRSAYGDVAAPAPDITDCNCIETGPDGLLDLTLKFATQAIVEAVGDVDDGDIVPLELTGILYDPIPHEIPIEGSDCILIKGKYKVHNKADINRDGVVNGIDFFLLGENWLICTMPGCD